MKFFLYPLLLPLLLVLGACSKSSLEDSIVGKVITFEIMGEEGQMMFKANGVMLGGQDGDLENHGLTYKVEGNKVVVSKNGENDYYISFSSSSPTEGDQIELGHDDDRLNGVISQIELADERKPVAETKGTEAVKAAPVNRKELEYREGLTYRKGSEVSYTGKSYVLHQNGLKKREENFKDGKPDGLQIYWHENGEKRVEANYKNGKEHGPWLSWHKNGQKLVESNFKDGKLDGLQLRLWHENGQKKREANYKDGAVISEKYWNSTGELVDSYEESLKE